MNPLDRSQLRSSAAYVDFMVDALADIEEVFDEYRAEFGEDVPQDSKDRVAALKADLRAEKALVAQLSEQDAG